MLIVMANSATRDQVDRVKQGLDPVGVIRDPKDDRPVRITSDDIDDLTHCVGCKHRVVQARSKDLIRSDAGIGWAAVNHVIEAAGAVIPEQTVEAPARERRHI